MSKITIEDIVTQFDRISADAHYTVDDNDIHLTINDFDNSEWVERKLVDEDLIEEIFVWLRSNADWLSEYFDHYYYFFGDIEVEVDYESSGNI